MLLFRPNGIRWASPVNVLINPTWAPLLLSWPQEILKSSRRAQIFLERMSAEQAGGIDSAPALRPSPSARGGLKSALQRPLREERSACLPNRQAELIPLHRLPVLRRKGSVHLCGSRPDADRPSSAVLRRVESPPACSADRRSCRFRLRVAVARFDRDSSAPQAVCLGF